MYAYAKRGLDIFFSLIAIIVFTPFLLLIIIILKFTGEGEIFYRQKRVGYHNQYFGMIKFATMLKNSPNIGTGTITLRKDPRVTKVGKFLRRSKLNELPQIFNVLMGDMSIVGPRPLVDITFNAYPENIRYKVYDSKPGITGIGSIIFRDEEALISAAQMPPHEFYEKHIAPYKGALEMWYNKNKSLTVDLFTIFITVWVIVFPKSRLMYKVFKNLPAYSAD